MNKFLILFSIIIFIFLTLTSLSKASTEAIDAGLGNKFEFSNTSIKKNKKINVYAYFDNDTDYDLKATVIFSIDNNRIKTEFLSIPRNTKLPFWTTIRITEQSSLKATIISLQKDTNGVLEGVFSNNKEIKMNIYPGMSVQKFDNLESTIADSSNNIALAAERTRLDINNSLGGEIDELEPVAKKDNGLTFKKIWLWILKILKIIASNIILSLIFFTFFVIYLFKYSKKGYHKLKK